MLGEATATAIPGGTAFLAKTAPGVVDDGKLILRGFDGGRCVFPLFVSGKHVVIVQKNDHSGTSITNLAEVAFDTVRTHFGDVAVYEVYEDEKENGAFPYLWLYGKDGHDSLDWMLVEQDEVPGFREYKC